jgi:hypothetical protein
LEVVRAVRAELGPHVPIGVKLNSADFQRGGMTEDDSAQVVLALAGAGVDLLEISGGNYESTAFVGAPGAGGSSGVSASTRAREAYFLDYAERVRTTLRAAGADLAWATADNPRKENLGQIFADMRAGLPALPFMLPVSQSAADPEGEGAAPRGHGRRLQPDVILNLPEGKHLIIDSKVSLIAYERFVNAETPEEQAIAIKEHIASLRSHIRGLSDKNYQNLYDVSLDFVLLFVPIEGAFSTALQAEPGLFQEAFDRNIALVSTTTLWTTLRTVGTLWRQERQNRNVGEIIRQASELYDKFVGFSDELIKVGNQMNTATTTYENAMKQLSQGKGNLVRRAEQLRQLGLKNSKNTHPSLLDRALQGESEEDKTDNL